MGVGRYAAADHRTVDVALEVVDRHHRRGLGGVLLDTIATVACAHMPGLTWKQQLTATPGSSGARRPAGAEADEYDVLEQQAPVPDDEDEQRG